MPDARLWMKIDLGERGQLGPGKIRLLEEIRDSGSISAAARAMKMSYRQAWLLVEEINDLCGGRAVRTSRGGSARGGAELTELGSSLIERYHRIVERANAAVTTDLQALAGALKPPHAKDPGRRARR